MRRARPARPARRAPRATPARRAPRATPARPAPPAKHGPVGPQGPSYGYFDSATGSNTGGPGIAEANFTLPAGHYIVSYGANVWNADSAFGMVAVCRVLRTGVILSEAETRASVLPGGQVVNLANSLGLDIAGNWLVQLRCEKASGNGSFQANNVQLTAIKVGTLN